MMPALISYAMILILFLKIFTKLFRDMIKLTQVNITANIIINVYMLNSFCLIYLIWIHSKLSKLFLKVRLKIQEPLTTSTQKA